MQDAALLFFYCLLIAGASLAGGWIPQWFRLTHRMMQILVSFVGGLMLGVSVLHLLPHGASVLESLDVAVRWMLAGVILMFFLLRVFHFHHHPGEEELAALKSSNNLSDARAGAPKNPGQGNLASPQNETVAGDSGDEASKHAGTHQAGSAGLDKLPSLPMLASPGCQHKGHAHAHHGPGHVLPASVFSWIGIFIGLSIHTLIDGMALAASVQVEARLHGGTERPFLAGLATFLAVLLHKPLDAMAITSLMAAGGWNTKTRGLANLAFSFLCPLGAALFFLGAWQGEQQSAAIIGRALALSAGVFLCIALSDLLPEIEFHEHDRVTLSLMLLAGVVAAAAMGLLEPHASHHDHGSHTSRQPEAASPHQDENPHRH